MDKDVIKNLLKSGFWGVIWSIVAAGLAYLIMQNTKYTYMDILFIEGIALIIVGFFSSIGGSPMGLPNMASTAANASYMQFANLEVTKNESRINKDLVKRTVSFGISSVAFIVGGIICVAINFIL